MKRFIYLLAFFFLLNVTFAQQSKKGKYGDGPDPDPGAIGGTHLAIGQAPIITMIENYRTGLLWKLFMNIPDIQKGLKKLGFSSLT